MNRRKFIKNTGVAAAAAVTIPYILPSGRLFAATGNRKVNHVVLCLFAGGVRNLESMQKAEGNLLRNILPGSEAISPDIAGSMFLLPSPGTPLLNYGTLYKQFRYNVGPTGHFNGHTTAITGNYTTTDLNIKMPPKFPTVFEYYRKHNSPTNNALNAWWVSNMLGPYPSLNYSTYPGYGPMYGANYMQPSTLFSQRGFNNLGNPKSFTSSEKTAVNQLREQFNKGFALNYSDQGGVMNDSEEAYQLENFLQQSFNEAQSGQYNNAFGVNFMTNDMKNILAAEKIIQQFKPELLVVNMQDVDIGHSNFTQYCNALQIADFCLAHLWNTIQSTPGMANDTILIAVPEHGRNLQPNTIQDSNGRYALDHTNDQMSREIFCLILGPSGVIKQNQTINSVTGESIDVVPTIAYALGFDHDIPSGLLPGQPLLQAFV
ncbi:MAG: twin-arginine translocation signal domain-containing protein [Bacteroidia bacterium]